MSYTGIRAYGYFPWCSPFGPFTSLPRHRARSNFCAITHFDRSSTGVSIATGSGIRKSSDHATKDEHAPKVDVRLYKLDLREHRWLERLAHMLSPMFSDACDESSPRGPVYTVLKRDVLYRAINEYQLSGSKLTAFADLLDQLKFDFSPLVSGGQTWYLCRGRLNEGLTPCRRMVPEIYFRTAVGKILKAADKADLTGDDLIEDLATAFSYAICSDHHRTIHKIVRAIEARQTVEQWRYEHRTSVRTMEARQTVEQWRYEHKPLESKPSPDRVDSPQPSIPLTLSEDTAVEPSSDADSLSSQATNVRVEVERDYQEYLRSVTRKASAVSLQRIKASSNTS